MTTSAEIGTWSCPPPPIDSARLLRIHKYRDMTKVRPVIRDAAEAAVAEIQTLCRPVANYVTIDIKSLKNNRLSLAGGTTLECPAFNSVLADSTNLLVFVLTVGPAVDTRVRALVDETFEPLAALFTESAAWLTIEAASRQLTKHLKVEFAKQGQALTLRMGPGYDYSVPGSDKRVRWDLEQQRELFELFGGADLPVRLTESCVMLPKMSRSGVFGLHPKSR